MTQTKNLLLALTAILLASCTTTRLTISPEQYVQKVADVQRSLADMGYGLTGTASNENNEIYVAGTSYSNTSGYGTAMGNDYSWHDTYTFADPQGHTASFEVKYRLLADDIPAPYVSGVEILQCGCSNPQDYNRICGTNGIVRTLGHIEPDQQSVFNDYSTGATLLLVIPSILLLAFGLTHLP